MQALLRRALAHECLEKFGAALSDFQRVRELEPGTKIASEGIVRATRALALEARLVANGGT
eukprot:scaffold418_cov386-Prasinococcus_capsulatus_cf.AAC.22